MISLRKSVGLISLLALSACTQTPKQMYNWDSYEQQAYNHMRSDGSTYQEEILVLEENVQKAKSRDQALPPGFHAHLGMLYLKDSQDDRAIAEFEQEATRFPEFQQYMTFLLNMLSGKDSVIESATAKANDPTPENPE